MKIFKTVTVLFLAFIMAVQPTFQTLADTPDYISEVKVFFGDPSAAETEGYVLLRDGKDPVDLNRDAGGGLGSKGEKAVYLGFKTTKDRGDAITDLALMNMKGGYRIKDYEVLMQQQMSAQIVPFVESFMDAIREYRANVQSEYPENRQRAEYIRGLMNKLTDDDCGGAGLGDLLLNDTVYEMAKPRYEALSDREKEKTSLYEINLQVRAELSDTEKNRHADILTLLAQANGNAVLLLESLIARAADNNPDTWVDRFCSLSYDDLVESTGLAPTDAGKEIDKLYGDSANLILDMWDTFREQLLSAVESEAKLDAMDVQMSSEKKETLQNFDVEKAGDQEIESLAEAIADTELDTEVFTNRLTDVLVKSYLENTKYDEGTLYDFFTMTKEEAEDSIEEIYTLAASLTRGQLASLEFISLSDLTVMAGTASEEYSDENFETFEQISVYDGVNREIYEKGGVALTSDAIRSDAASQALNEETPSFPIRWWTFVTGGLALSSAAAFGISLSKYLNYTNKINELSFKLSQGSNAIKDMKDALYNFGNIGVKAVRENRISNGARGINVIQYNEKIRNLEKQVENLRTIQKANRKIIDPEIERLSARSSLSKYLSVGFSVAMVALSALTVYLTWRDMTAYYEVDMTPMPRFIVDEKDLIGYSKNGEKVVLKNQSAYYKLAECSRGTGDEFYKVLGTGADLNGDVGRQWLALYSVKKELMQPILASSLKAVVGSAQIPSGYSTGIHMFGSDAAFNLNSNLYDWDSDAPAVYVYFDTDKASAGSTASNFTAGTLALSGGVGVALGSMITALAMKKRKKDPESAENK